MAEAKDMVPDKETYQVNRRRMSWVVLVMMACMTVAIIGWPERYENANVMEMAYLALSGLVAAYFGATAFQSVKRTVKKK